MGDTDGMIRDGVIEEIFEKTPEGKEMMSHVAIWERASQVQRTVRPGRRFEQRAGLGHRVIQGKKLEKYGEQDLVTNI